MGEALRTLLTRRTYVYVVLIFIVAAFLNAGLVQFTTSFFMRTHGFSLQHANLVFGVGEGIFAFIGTLSGGAIVDRLQNRIPRIAAWLSAFSVLACGILFAIAFYAQSAWIGIVALLFASFFRWVFIGPSFGMMQAVVPDRTRATAIAVYLLCASLAAGLGSLALGVLSDLFANAQLMAQHIPAAACAVMDSAASGACARARADGLQVALTIFSLGYGICALLFLRAAKFMREEYAIGATGR